MLNDLSDGKVVRVPKEVNPKNAATNVYHIARRLGYKVERRTAPDGSMLFRKVA